VTLYAELMFLHPVGYAGHVVHSGASRPRNIDSLFFMLGWAHYGFHKKRAGTRCAELVFLHPVRSAADVMHSGAFGPRNVDALFFMLEWARCGFRKMRARKRYAELVSLHPMRSLGHVVHSDASGRKTSMHYFSCSGGPGAVFRKNASAHVTQNLCFGICGDLQVM
jgi:hypothetical protein